ncbi:MAG TPA: hypothetical protein PLR93_10585 [Anaerolineales bacterium]|nr:hypothetical protein [Anaerolineales bacterium]HNE03048.1 hypothetical protein [Anaerolineales bacterium]HNF94173.1 hypothetical protein [Anaerolineales bacterium]HNH27458.1 hypothetical protein [Anaerolineales bacterium]HNM36030.1 hypothetical protein [Anaerolineales bacterium]
MLILFSVLRFVHIIAGIFWAGGAILMNLIIGPAIGATGDAGKQFVGHLMGKTIFSKFMLASGAITVLAGSILYGIDSNWFSSGWMMSPTGTGFGIGAISGIIALVFGFLIGSTNGKLALLGMQIQGKPTNEQLAALGALRKRQVIVTNGNTIFILISIALMASARLFG